LLLCDIILKPNVFHVPESSPSLKWKYQRLGKLLIMKTEGKYAKSAIMQIFTVILLLYFMHDRQLGLA
jgi:hypothetical protein